ncbi:MAG: TonB-dependent receptor [Acidobacteriaceae bacterium]|nr:TonB-dependent receptor [Acidobacteriaceae bacterium]
MARPLCRILLLLCFILQVRAQTPDTARLDGKVIDESHAAIADAKVSITDASNGLRRTANTDANGKFTEAGLPVSGVYHIVAEKSGFKPSTMTNLALIGGTTARITIQLSVGGAQTEITVTGAAGDVQTDSPQTGNHLSAEKIEQTPILNRRITYLPLLNAANRPALNQGDVFMNQYLFTTNGSGRRQAWFEVDGSTGNDSWGRQTIFTNIPLAAVQEMDVLTNAFSAEYGGSTGSVVNIITKSGSDQFHGDAIAVGRPPAMGGKLSGFTSENAANGNDVTSDLLLQGGLALSGPISSAGHTQFFAAAEYSRQDRASPVTSPIAPGSFVGRYRDWMGDLRVDHQFGDRNDLFLRGNLDSFYDTNPNGTVGGNTLPSVGRVFRRRTYSVGLGETATLRSSVVNNLRLQFQLASPITEFDPFIYTTQYQVPISAGGTFISGTSQSALLLNRQYQANDTLALVLGRHQIRFGADVIYARNGGDSKEFGGPIYLGQFIYKTCTQPLAFCESQTYLGNINNVQSYTQSYGHANYLVHDTLWALFVQEDYRLRPDLTINIGLRYEQQTFTDSRKNFAPRVGFAYDWGGRGKTVIRSGLGIYYSQIVDNSEANYALGGPTGVFNYTAGAGQTGFPVSVAAAPLPAFPAGAVAPVRSLYVRPGDAAFLNQFFPVSTLLGYPNQLLNPYSEQWTFGVQQQLAKDWVLSVDYLGSHTIRINRPLDVDPPTSFIRTTPGQVRSAQAANCTRPYWVWWYSQNNLSCNPSAPTNPQPPYGVIQTDVNNGYAYYHALDVNLSHRFSRRLEMLASYVWSHAIDNVDPDVPSQNPNDPRLTGTVENGNAIFDQRQRFVLSGVVLLPFKINFGGVATFGSGLPYNVVTGVTNSGDNGATTDRPVINGAVIGRNAGRGQPIYDLSPFLERSFSFATERVKLTLRAESFNVLNHPNFVGYSGTWGNGATPGAGFGQPLAGITNQLPARSFQFSGRVTF